MRQHPIHLWIIFSFCHYLPMRVIEKNYDSIWMPLLFHSFANKNKTNSKKTVPYIDRIKHLSYEFSYLWWFHLRANSVKKWRIFFRLFFIIILCMQNVFGFIISLSIQKCFASFALRDALFSTIKTYIIRQTWSLLSDDHIDNSTKSGSRKSYAWIIQLLADTKIMLLFETNILFEVSF